MKHLISGVLVVCVALLGGSCDHRPQSCEEADDYLRQCAAAPASCEQTVVESIFAMGCDSPGLVGKADGFPGSGSVGSEPPLCRIDARTAAGLAADPGWFSSATFQRLLDEQTSSRAYPGNAVTLLKDGVQSYPRRLANIAQADAVLVKVYNFRDDACGRQVIDALLARLEQGSRVFVQVDVKGNFRNPLTLNRMRTGARSAVPGWLEPVIAAGGFVIPSNAPVTLSEALNPIFGKDHEKYLLTWKRGQPVKLIMGGMNIGDEWGYGGDPGLHVEGELKGQHGFRDTDVEVVGPVTEAVLAHYLQDARFHATRYAGLITSPGIWSDPKLPPQVGSLPAMMEEGLRQLAALIDEIDSQRDAAYPLAGSALVRHVTNLPEASEQSGSLGVQGQYIEKMLCLLMSAVPAQTEVRLSNAFFLPPDTFLTPMRRALERGVSFNMLLNPPEAIPDAAFGEVSRRARCLFRRMHDEIPAAAERLLVHEWHGDPENGHSWLHHKIWSFGAAADAPAVVGSSNLDFHSLRRNSEGVLLIQDAAFKREFDAMLTGDFDQQDVRRLLREAMPGKVKCFFESLWLPTPQSWL